MRFKVAVRQTGGLANAYRRGLQALMEADRRRISCKQPQLLSGSISLDEALSSSHANDPRWDYGIGVKVPKMSDRVAWVEVHPASSGHVQEVIEKNAWLLRWLKSSARTLDQLDRQFYWIASGKVRIPLHSPQRKKIAGKGIHFAGERLQLC